MNGILTLLKRRPQINKINGTKSDDQPKRSTTLFLKILAKPSFPKKDKKIKRAIRIKITPLNACRVFCFSLNLRGFFL